MKPQLDDYMQITDRFFYCRYIRLGGGAYGQVYKGYDNQEKRYIAVKQIPRVNLCGSEDKEIEIMSKLNHPNIMRCYGSHGDKYNPDGVFMFLELCQKGTLKQLIANKISQKTAYELFIQLVQGMAYTNEQKIFHRDLKPDNLLITANQQLKIADFGIARQIQQGKQMTFKKCTPVYSAPEVYNEEIYQKYKQVYNETCDVFSSGYILYEMLTGEQLTKGLKTAKQLNQFLKKHQQTGFTIDHPALSQSWANLLKRMLQFNPQKRINFIQIRNLLKTFIVPVNKLPALIKVDNNEIQQSALIISRVKKMVQVILNRNNYFINLLKAFHLYQQQKSLLVPRIYKILLLYFCLTHYCLLTEGGMKQIDKKQEFFVPDYDKSLQDLTEDLTNADKSEMYNYFRVVSTQVNKGKQQMKIYISSQLIPLIDQILSYPQNHPQRKVLQEFNMNKIIHRNKSGDYEPINTYSTNFKKCRNNLYKTSAELTILSTQDLRLYLIILYISKIDDYVKIQSYQKAILPPPFDQVRQLSRQKLLQIIKKLKNQC